MKGIDDAIAKAKAFKEEERAGSHLKYPSFEFSGAKKCFVVSGQGWDIGRINLTFYLGRWGSRYHIQLRVVKGD
jgi:hypothetical protein